MRLERLNYNKIKIFLTFDDLLERGLTKEDLWMNAPKVQQLFKDMMNEASVELGFEADGTVDMEIFSLQAQGMVVIVTKEQQDSDSDEFDEDDLDNLQDDFIELQVTLDETENILYEFNDFEDMISMTHALYPLGITGGKLYSFQNRFYLLFDEDDIVGVSQATFIALLAEYGNPATLTIYRIMEYGKELMSEHALKQINQYFIKKAQ